MSEAKRRTAAGSHHTDNGDPNDRAKKIFKDADAEDISTVGEATAPMA